MTKLPILDFKGLLVAINPAHVLKIEERESKDGTPRCIIQAGSSSISMRIGSSPGRNGCQ